MAQLTQSDLLAIEMCVDEIAATGETTTIFKNVAEYLAKKGYKVVEDFWSMGWVITRG